MENPPVQVPAKPERKGKQQKKPGVSGAKRPEPEQETEQLPHLPTPDEIVLQREGMRFSNSQSVMLTSRILNLIVRNFLDFIWNMLSESYRDRSLSICFNYVIPGDSSYTFCEKYRNRCNMAKREFLSRKIYHCFPSVQTRCERRLGSYCLRDAKRRRSICESTGYSAVYYTSI